MANNNNNVHAVAVPSFDLLVTVATMATKSTESALVFKFAAGNTGLDRGALVARRNALKRALSGRARSATSQLPMKSRLRNLVGGRNKFEACSSNVDGVQLIFPNLEVFVSSAICQQQRITFESEREASAFVHDLGFPNATLDPAEPSSVCFSRMMTFQDLHKALNHLGVLDSSFTRMNGLRRGRRLRARQRQQ